MKLIIKNRFLRKVIFCVLFPIVFIWLGSCWLIMKLGHGLYVTGDWLSGHRLDEYNWTEEL